jgi:hypothetical protein
VQFKLQNTNYGPVKIVNKNDAFNSFDASDKASLNRLCQNFNVDDDPALIFIWRDLNPLLTAIREHVAADDNDPNAPVAPFQLPQPLTSVAFKNALMNHVQLPEAPLAVFNGALKCSPGGICQVSARLSNLCYDPWFEIISARIVNNGGHVVIADIITPRTKNDLELALQSPRDRPALWN